MAGSQKTVKVNSIFFKSAAAIILSIGLVSGTITFVFSRHTSQVSQEFMAEMVRSNSVMLGDNIAGAVKFGKSDQVNSAFDRIFRDTGGQINGSVAIGADSTLLGDRVRDSGSRDALVALARNALETESDVAAADGRMIARPLRFGKDGTVVGALANSWSPDILDARIQEGTVFAITTAGTVFAAAVAAALFLLARSVVRPLNRCRDAILRISREEYDIEIPGRARGDEIGDMGKSLEVLRAQLSAAQSARQEARLQSAAFSGCSSAMMIIGPDMAIRYMNPRMSALLATHDEVIRKTRSGFSAKDLVGLPFTTLHDRCEEITSQLRQRRGETVSRILGYGDLRIQLTINAVRMEDGEVAGFVTEWADVTEERLNGAVIEAIEANQIKAEFDISGILLRANEPFFAALGLIATDLKTLGLRDLSADDAKTPIRTQVDQAMRDGAYLGKLTFRAKDGGTRVVDGSLSCVKNYEGKPARPLLLGKDITSAESALETARVEREDAERNQNHVVEALRVGLKSLSGGDLTSVIGKPFAGAYEDLRLDYNSTVKTLAEALREIAGNAENIHNEAHDISTTTDGLSRRTETTAATLEQTAAALDELTSSVNAAAAGASRADDAVVAAKASAENSGMVVLETVSAMDQIAASSERITSIIKVIDDIAFQTNLLALNAGVEAARAGDAGRGFAVVASEVRALAQRSSDAAREIKDLIAQSGTQVKTGVDLVGRTGEALQQIVNTVSEISTLVSDIAVSSRQQSANLTEINKAVTQLDQSTQQNAARLEETTAASEALRTDAVALVETVSHFRLSEDTREHGGAVAPRKGVAKNVVLDRPDPTAGQASPVVARQAPEKVRHAKPVALRNARAGAIGIADAEWEDF